MAVQDSIKTAITFLIFADFVVAAEWHFLPHFMGSQLQMAYGAECDDPSSRQNQACFFKYVVVLNVRFKSVL